MGILGIDLDQADSGRREHDLEGPVAVVTATADGLDGLVEQAELLRDVRCPSDACSRKNLYGRVPR